MRSNKPSCPCGSGKPYRKCCGKGTPVPGVKPHLVDLPDGRRLPAAQVIQEGMTLHQAGRVRRAAELYRRTLEVEPRQADALHLLGLTEHQLGNNARAVELIHSAIEINPRVAMFHSNLGAAYRALGEAKPAEAACRRALDLDPSLPEAHLNLGGALLLRQEFDAALAAYARALALRPGYVDALLGQGDAFLSRDRHSSALQSYRQVLEAQPANAAALTRIGITLRKQGRMEDAIRHYEEAIRRCPAIPELHNNVAILYQRAGRLEDAAASLRRLLELTPDDGTARHLLNAVEGTTTGRAPAGYVRDVFDGYAENFELHLVDKLGYRVPEQLAQIVKQSWGEGAAEKTALDMGCGTGLFGAAIADACQRLVGIDIAPKMVAKAREKGIYTELVVADILLSLKNCAAASFDLVAATDVFVYVGDLAAIFMETRRVLRSGGLFAFSVESVSDGGSDYVLDITGRYRQSETYLRRLAGNCGLRIAHIAPVVIRHEAEQQVCGYLCVFVAP